MMIKMNLVQYAGEFWVTLADYTQTRDIGNYSDRASIKSAIRTYIVRTNPDNYIAFRGEQQIKNIIAENKDNPLFDSESLVGHTRTALIHWSMLDALNERFPVAEEDAKDFNRFMEEAEDYMEDKTEATLTAAGIVDDVESSSGVSISRNININPLENRSMLERYFHTEISRIDKQVEALLRNKEKYRLALNAIQGIEPVEPVKHAELVKSK